MNAYQRRVYIILFALLFIVLACFMIEPVSQMIHESSIQRAVMQLNDGKYDEVIASMESKKFGDAMAWRLLDIAKGCKTWQEGDVRGAYRFVGGVSTDWLRERDANDLADLLDEIKKTSALLLEEDEKAAEEKLIAGLARKVPYVGMKEKYIAFTSLGDPSENVGHNWKLIRGGKTLTNIYNFYQGQTLVFSARCAQGKVIDVWDYRNQPTPSRTADLNKLKKQAEEENNSDPYHASDYSNFDSFYEQHYYDFYDYYDAENYYRRHH